jgi:hypothetical protein
MEYKFKPGDLIKGRKWLGIVISQPKSNECIYTYMVYWFRVSMNYPSNWINQPHKNSISKMSTKYEDFLEKI